MLPIALSDEAMREIIDAAALVPINLRNISKAVAAELARFLRRTSPSTASSRSSGFADGCCTVETVTFFAGSGGQHAPTSTNGIHRDMAGDYRIS